MITLSAHTRDFSHECATFRHREYQVWYYADMDKDSIFTINSDVKENLYRTAKDLGIKILAMEKMPDHIHMLIECKPQCRISDAVKVFKGNTAR